GIRGDLVAGVQTCALPILLRWARGWPAVRCIALTPLTNAWRPIVAREALETLRAWISIRTRPPIRSRESTTAAKCGRSRHPASRSEERRVGTGSHWGRVLA